MAGDRAQNSLKRALGVELNSTNKQFKDTLSFTDQNDLYRLSIGDRSSCSIEVAKIAKGANVDVELYALRGSKKQVLRRIGRIDFSDLKTSDIRRSLNLIGRSKGKGNKNESLNLTLEAGEYFLRIFWRQGATQYQLNLSATPEIPGGESPSPSPNPIPSPSPNPSPSPTSFVQNWLRQIGTNTNDYAYGVATSSSGVYVAGTVSGTLPGKTTAGRNDNFVTQYDFGGNLVPSSLNPFPRQFGTSGADTSFDIATDSSGNYYVVGTSVTFIGAIPSGSVGFVQKYNADGELMWGQAIDKLNFDIVSSIALDNQGNFFVTGLSASTTSSIAFIEKRNINDGQLVTGFDGDGRIQLGDGIAGSEGASSIAVDSVGDVYITGIAGATLVLNLDAPFAGGDAFVAKFNGSTGAAAWSQKTLSGGTEQDYGRGIAISGSEVYVTGNTNGTLPGQLASGNTDGFLARYDTATGTLQWVKQFGTTALDESQGITISGNGNVILTGETQGSLFGNTPLGGSDAWIAEFNGNGDEIRSAQFGTNVDDEGYNITINGSSIYVIGQTLGSFDGTNQGLYDAWVGQFI
jgi:hypothetical protein